MDIRHRGEPITNRLFEFQIYGGAKPVNIKVFIGDRLVLNGDCADPPCHESLTVPEYAVNSMLQIIAKDSLGEEITRSFVIRRDRGSDNQRLMVRG
jgi:hypothetical protein